MICEFCGKEIKGTYFDDKGKSYHLECHRAINLINEYPDKVKELLNARD